MAAAIERSRLHVEGDDDKNSLIHLLIRHGIDYDTKPWPAEYPEIKPIGGVDSLLEGIPTAVRVSDERPIGFVLDADSPLIDRWRSVLNRLKEVGVDTPAQPPAKGFIGESATFQTRVGVWLMPDNQHDGTLETFLKTLVDGGDSLIGHATSATKAAKEELKAEFVETDQEKAILHAWLAWQKEPGKPYGTAIRARYFRHDSPAAEAFVAWFKRLYGID